MFRSFVFFFFNDTATTEIYTLSLHDALPILAMAWTAGIKWYQLLILLALALPVCYLGWHRVLDTEQKSRLLTFYYLLSEDRKSTRLNSSHANISYAVFCLKKKKTKNSNVYSV